MKIIILIMIHISFSGFAQEEQTGKKELLKNEERQEVPEIGKKAIPQLQEEDVQNRNPNPFQVGPYYQGKYIFTPPEDIKEK